MLREKHCSRCKQVKPITAFTRMGNQKSGYNPQCRSCRQLAAAEQHRRTLADPVRYAHHRAARRAYYHRTRALRTANRRRYYAENAGEIARQHREYMRTRPDLLEAMHERRRLRLAGVEVNDLTRAQWEAIKQAFNYCCAYCGEKPKRLTKDHITPLFHGGGHTLHNVVPACQQCNSRKYVGPPLCPVQPLLLVG